MLISELLRELPHTGRVPELDVSFVTDDSRKVQPGCLFVCIAGAHFDGHDAAAQAIAAGAVCVVAQKDVEASPCIRVKNTRRAYALLCAAFYGHPARTLTLVGVTGTNGKTTTAYLLKQIFDHAGCRTGLIGTLMNMVDQQQLPAELTTPDPWELQGLFAQMADAGCTHCFMEVSSQALDQQRVAGLQFKAGIFTNLTQDHLDYHKTFEKYLQAKRKLFRQCESAILNLDDEAARRIADGTGVRAVYTSISRDDADYTAKNVRLNADGVAYELVSRSRIGRVRFGVPGTFSVYNSMAAACTAMELGLELQTILEALAACKGVRGRMEVVPTSKDYTVIIDYAHTPDGLENILTALRQTTAGRLITVFGCGGDRDKAKRPIMGKLAAERSDVVVVTSDNPRSEDPGAIIADIIAGIPKTRAQIITQPDREKAIEAALKAAKPNDVVLLAGKGQETYQVLATGKIHMDEREIVAKLEMTMQK